MENLSLDNNIDDSVKRIKLRISGTEFNKA